MFWDSLESIRKCTVLYGPEPSKNTIKPCRVIFPPISTNVSNWELDYYSQIFPPYHPWQALDCTHTLYRQTRGSQSVEGFSCCCWLSQCVEFSSRTICVSARSPLLSRVESLWWQCRVSRDLSQRRSYTMQSRDWGDPCSRSSLLTPRSENWKFSTKELRSLRRTQVATISDWSWVWSAVSRS